MVLSSASGSTGAMEKNAALNVAIRIGLGGGGGGLGVGLERCRGGQRRWELRRRRFLLRNLSMMEFSTLACASKHGCECDIRE